MRRVVIAVLGSGCLLVGARVHSEDCALPLFPPVGSCTAAECDSTSVVAPSADANAMSCDVAPSDGSLAGCTPDDVFGTCGCGGLAEEASLCPGLESSAWKFEAGGSFRYRYMNEHNRLRPNGNVEQDTYDLFRTTVFGETGNDWITGRIELIDAVSFNEELRPVAIDENRLDFLQYYGDVNLFDFEGGALRLRVGRQFLNYGKQRLVSNLGWANTFRNFEGFRLYYADEGIKIDAFAVQPVNGAGTPLQHHPYSRDRADASQWFSGVYISLLELPGALSTSDLDLYWLNRYEDDIVLGRLDGNRHTLGARFYGSQLYADEELKLAWDLESAYQFGSDDFVNGGFDQTVRAGFAAADVAATANKVSWKPTVRGIVYYGSGDGSPTDGTNGSFDTLFPLGHAYWGQIDNLNGSNLIDVGPELSVQPAEKFNLALQYHTLVKAHAQDHIYNVAGTPLGNLTTPDRHIGNEIDLIGTYKVSDSTELQAGYRRFFYGDAVHNNAGIAPRGDASFYYLQALFSF